MRGFYIHKKIIPRGVIVLWIIIMVLQFIYVNNLIEEVKQQESENIQLFISAQEYLYSNNTNDDILFIFNQIIESNKTIPLIWTDNADHPIDYKNIHIPVGLSENERTVFLKKKIEEMKSKYPPLIIQVDENLENKVFYQNSKIIDNIKSYYLIEIFSIFIVLIVGYLFFSISRKYEQNMLWIGLAKETAHQIATPLTSLMSWIEHIKIEEKYEEEVLLEMSKDTQRFEMIVQRFSNIGSIPILKIQNIYLLIYDVVEYLKKRISTKVKISITAQDNYITKVNKVLFEWAIENLCKNAIDSMKGVGKIDIFIKYSRNNKKIYIDFKDNGKGIQNIKQIFYPGFTTKKRGWGIGLTLTKRIINQYHKGSIFVLETEKNKGTTFRIILPKHT